MKDSYIIVHLDRHGIYRQSHDCVQFRNFEDAFLECRIRNKAHDLDFIHIPAKISDGIHVDFKIISVNA